MNLFGRERRWIVTVVLLLIAVSAIVTLALNLENLALGPDVTPETGEPSGGGGGGGVQPSDQGLSVFFQYLLPGLILIFAILLIYVVLTRRARAFLIEMIGFILAMIILLAFFALWVTFAGAPPASSGTAGSEGSDPTGLPEDPVESALVASGGAAGLGIVALAFTLVFLVVVLARRFSTRDEIAPPPDVRRRFIDHVEDTIYRLQLGEEVRSAILRCYSDMIGLFEKRGLRYGSHVTARELEALTLERLGLSGPSGVRLREMFEEARYSSHDLSEENRGKALQCLNAVKEELEALSVDSH